MCRLMEEKIDLTSIIIMIGETNANLKEISTLLTRIDKRLNTLNTTTRREIKTAANVIKPAKMVFTVKRTVTDK